MSHRLTLDISDDAFSALEREAASAGVSPASLLRASVEQIYGRVTLAFGLATETAKVNQERVDLLVRKAKGASFSSEDERRLAALSERVRQLIPRATREDFTALSEMRSRAEESESLARQVRSKYRLGDAE